MLCPCAQDLLNATRAIVLARSTNWTTNDYPMVTQDAVAGHEGGRETGNLSICAESDCPPQTFYESLGRFQTPHTMLTNDAASVPRVRWQRQAIASRCATWRGSSPRKAAASWYIPRSFVKKNHSITP